jgi:hypothetical protein
MSAESPSHEGFIRDELAARGFVGWKTFAQLAEGQLAQVPQAGGVYVVWRSSEDAPRYLIANPGGRFKDRDPTVAPEALQANWVEGAEVVYVGKADQLRRRLKQFMDFGTGKPIGHWGGRLIWQLSDSSELLVAWRETPGEAPKDVETRLIAAFRKRYDKPPFANEPHRLGR